MEYIDLTIAQTFLGHEFLLWLWHKVDQYDAPIQFENSDLDLPLAVSFEDVLILELPGPEPQRITYRGGDPGGQRSSSEYIATGARILQARLRFCIGERDYLFTTDGHASFRSVKLPPILGDTDEDKFCERLYLLEELQSAYRVVFRHFMSIRSTVWDREKRELSRWRSQVLS